MPSLLQFQQELEAAIRGGEGAAANYPPAIAVYRNTWRKALLDALSDNYPVVAALLGDAEFYAAALDFLSAHPPSTPVLADYGREFADHLNASPSATHLPYLVDIARLEHYVTEAAIAADASPLDPHVLSDMPPSDLLLLRPCLNPSLRLAWFDTPAVTIWRAHQQQGVFEELEPVWSPEGALVVRKASQVSVKAVDRPTHRFAASLLLGHNLGDAATATADLHPDADISAIFASLITSGALVQSTCEEA